MLFDRSRSSVNSCPVYTPFRSPVFSVGLLLLVFLSRVHSQAVLHDHGAPTNYEQYMLELINAARANPSAEAARLGIELNQGLTSGTISPQAKPPLTFHPKLIAAARGHSDWMISSGIFSHTGVGNTSPTQRAALVGYNFPVAENIGYQSTSGSPDYLSMTRAVHDSLVVSPSHRRNLMTSTHAVVGLGIRPGLFGGFNAFMATQNFSSGAETEDSGPFLLGVAYSDNNGNGAYDVGEGSAAIRVDTSFRTHYAVTSASGGYAIPVQPVATNTEIVQLPFAVRGVSWDAIAPHDANYRARMLAAAPLVLVDVYWSGGLIAGTSATQVAMPRPARINYRLMGTDGWFYDRSMITSHNIKHDFAVLDAVPMASPSPAPSPAAPGTPAPSPSPTPEPIADAPPAPRPPSLPTGSPSPTPLSGSTLPAPASTLSPGLDRTRPTVRITSPATLRGADYTLAARLADNVRPVILQYRLRAPGARAFGKWTSVKLRNNASKQNWSQPRIKLGSRGVWAIQVRVIDAAKNHSLVPTLRVNRTR